MAKGSRSKPLVSFIYLGRRGALGRFTLKLAQAAARFDDYDFEFVISSNNEIADDFREIGLDVTRIDTFDRATPYNLTAHFFLPAERCWSISRNAPQSQRSRSCRTYDRHC